MSKRRERRERAKERYREQAEGASLQSETSLSTNHNPHTHASTSSFVHFYERTYKQWLIIPTLMLLLALIQVGYQTATTGSFLHKSVELKGGLTITLTNMQLSDADLSALKNVLTAQFSSYDIQPHFQKGAASLLIIKADIVDPVVIGQFKEQLSQFLKIPAQKIDQNLEITGASIGDNFFKQTLIALVVAFLFMGLVVILYLRTLAPALAVILAAFSDMAVTLAVVNLLGIKLSTAGIVAFLFLIGYSVDTDMLLSARVLRRKEGTVMERVVGAMKTGLTMTFATLAAVVVALFFSQSDVIRQIMLVLLIGLVVDIINTWIQNVGILVWYLEKKHGKG